MTAPSRKTTEAQLHIYALGYQELTGKNAGLGEIYEPDDGKRKPRAVDEDSSRRKNKNEESCHCAAQRHTRR